MTNSCRLYWGGRTRTPRLSIGLRLLKLRYGLQISNQPTIGAGSHEHDIVRDNVFFVDDLSFIQKLQLVFSRVVEFNGIAFGGVKYRVQMMSLICVTAAEAGTLLAYNRLP